MTKDELLKELGAEKVVGGRNWPFDAFGIECGEGWHPLVIPFCRKVVACGGKILQVKEKFGGLRIYYSMPETAIAENPHKKFTNEWYEQESINWFAANHEVIYRFLDMASFHVCEDCGESMTAKVGGKGWLRTLCDNCRKESGRGEVEE